MMSFFIKIGKATNSIKKEGTIQGGKKVVEYFGTFLKTLAGKKTGDILFITGGVGDSARYRVFNVTEELNLHGLRSAVAMQDDPFLSRYADKFKIFIFHKTIFNPKIRIFIEKIKAQKKEIVFEADDLLFDPAFQEKIDYFKNINVLERKSYEAGLGREILTDPYVQVSTTTTSFLADTISGYGKKVFIVPNKLSESDLKLANEILNKGFRDEKAVKLGYFSGSMGHNRDFNTITDALMEVLEKYPNISLVLVGPLDIESKLNKFAEQIIKLPFVSRDRHFENISKIDVNLAPLEIGNPFCESKSELKFFEAGILGIPTVAAATKTFKEAIDDGVDGFTASSIGEWAEKLEKLITNKELRESMGKKAREKCLKKYTNKNSGNEEYYNYLRSKL